MAAKTVNTKKIKATYRNGVIEPLNKINLPEGQELEIELILPPKTSHELSREEKRALIQKMNGSMKGTWGKTVEEIDSYIKSERQSWDREF
ncbi:antitoxin family protein [Candidatus Poribacteria bacterium]|nr:antitoxin family protein [Candidatus Poribacteria bacterium]